MSKDRTIFFKNYLKILFNEHFNNFKKSLVCLNFFVPVIGGREFSDTLHRSSFQSSVFPSFHLPLPFPKLEHGHLSSQLHSSFILLLNKNVKSEHFFQNFIAHLCRFYKVGI